MRLNFHLRYDDVLFLRLTRQVRCTENQCKEVSKMPFHRSQLLTPKKKLYIRYIIFFLVGLRFTNLVYETTLFKVPLFKLT